MTVRYYLLTLILLCLGSTVYAADDYKKSAEYQALYEPMLNAFNEGDSATFFPALSNLQDYLVKQGDMHNYYTQRCNEIVFLMNRQKIYEAYQCALKMTRELREKGLEKEMYMAKNMMGHINRYCGNKAEARKNWEEALKMMEKEDYQANMPPIILNIVNIIPADNVSEEDSLLEQALTIAKKYAPERVFDIETRQAVSYYNHGDIKKFQEAYKAYKEGEKMGKTSVNGRNMEIYYQASIGNFDEAIKMAKEDLDGDGGSSLPFLYEKAGRWEEAYKAQEKQTAQNDSIDNVVIINSMQGIRQQVQLFETEREANRLRIIGLSATLLLLVLLILALTYIVHTRKKHFKELQTAYDRAMESEQMKSSFVRNISHEVRTPLNIISGFSQVIADPELTESVDERKKMARMMEQNANKVATLIDEIIDLSLIESTKKLAKNDQAKMNETLSSQLKDYKEKVNPGVEMKYESTLSNDFTLLTNTNMLKRIINALLENAVKYTNEGYIALRADKEDQILTITVEDTGCGIPVEEAEHIFERFVKLNTFKEGIGLGLHLARKLSEQLDGTLTLDTSYAHGARFHLRLPI